MTSLLGSKTALRGFIMVSNDDKLMITIQVVLEMLDAIKNTTTDEELDAEFERIIEENKDHEQE